MTPADTKTDKTMDQTTERPGYYAVLPAGVRYDNRLKAAEKILYAEITALTEARGYCYASNGYFCALYEVDESTLRRWLAHLRDLGYIQIDLVNRPGGRERQIHLADPPCKNAPHTVQKCADPPCKNAPQNNTRLITTGTTTARTREDLAQVVAAYEGDIGTVPRSVANDLVRWTDEFGAALVVAAIGEAAANNKRNAAYVRSILKRCRDEGIKTPDALRAGRASEQTRHQPNREVKKRDLSKL